MATILIVDDSPSMRQLLSALLVRAGHLIVEARDGVDALEQAQATEQVDLALVDVNIPHINGISLVRQLRAVQQTRLIPILMLTTEERREFRDEARKAGATGWVVKPFQPNDLLSLVKRLLAR